MRYNKQKLLQMTSDELLAVAAEFGIADAQALDTQALVNTIVGAQADQALGAYQAREDALQPKRRTRVVLSSPAAQRVETKHMKGERVLATVGSELQTMTEMQEAQSQQPLPVGVRKAQKAMEQFIQQNEVLNPVDEPELIQPETEVVQPAEAQPVAEEPVVKKRGRKRKVVEPEADTQQSIEIPEEPEIVPQYEPEAEAEVPEQEPPGLRSRVLSRQQEHWRSCLKGTVSSVRRIITTCRRLTIYMSPSSRSVSMRSSPVTRWSAPCVRLRTMSVSSPWRRLSASMVCCPSRRQNVWRLRI